MIDHESQTNAHAMLRSSKQASVRQWDTCGRHCFIAVTANMTLQEDLTKLLSRENKPSWQLDIRKLNLCAACPSEIFVNFFLTPMTLIPPNSHNKMVTRRGKIIIILEGKLQNPAGE